MTLRDYLNIVRERLVLVLATVVIVVATAMFFSLRQIPEFTTSARLRVQPLGAGSEVAEVLDQVLNYRTTVLTEAELVRSTNVAARVLERLKLDMPPEDLIQQVTVEAQMFTEVLKVTARAVTPDLAKAIADGFAEEYINERRERAITDATDVSQRIAVRLREAQQELRALDASLVGVEPGSTQYQLKTQDRDRLVATVALLTERHEALIDSDPLKNGAGEVIEPAPLPPEPSSPNHIRNGILGFLVSLPVAIGLTLLRESLNDTIKTKEEAEQLTGSQTLALIPTDPLWVDDDEAYLSSRDDPGGQVAEAYRTLRVNLEFAADGKPVRYAVVTSPGRGEGKSATAANLGLAFAAAGRKTVLVSADMREPRLQDFIGMPASPGFVDALRDPVDKSWLHAVEPNLWFVPSGPSAPHLIAQAGRKSLEGLFGRLGLAREPTREASVKRSGSKIGAARTKRGGVETDMVIFDTPSVLRASEVPALASAVDGVVLVLESGVSRRTATLRAAEQIRKVGGRILGVVLIGVRPDDDFARDETASPRRVGRALDRVIEGLRR